LETGAELSNHNLQQNADDPKRTSSVFLFNYLIRERNQPRRNGKSERFGGLKSDHEFVFGGLKDRQVGRLRTVEDLSDVGACVSVSVCDIGSITDEATIDGIFAKLINGGQFVLCRERNYPIASCVEVWIRHHEQRADALLKERCKAGI